MLDKLKEKMQGENLRDAYKMVKKAIPFTWRGRALAFLVKKYIDNGYNFLDEGQKGRPSQAKDTVRLFINIGKNHDANQKSLTEYLVKKGKLKKDALIKLDILDKYSFVNLKAGSEKKLMKNLSGKKFGKYSVNIEESREKRTTRDQNGRGRRPSNHKRVNKPGSGTRRRSTMKSNKPMN